MGDGFGKVHTTAVAHSTGVVDGLGGGTGTGVSNHVKTVILKDLFAWSHEKDAVFSGRTQHY